MISNTPYTRLSILCFIACRPFDVACLISWNISRSCSELRWICSGLFSLRGTHQISEFKSKLWSCTLSET